MIPILKMRITNTGPKELTLGWMVVPRSIRSGMSFEVDEIYPACCPSAAAKQYFFKALESRHLYIELVTNFPVRISGSFYNGHPVLETLPEGTAPKKAALPASILANAPRDHLQDFVDKRAGKLEEQPETENVMVGIKAISTTNPMGDMPLHMTVGLKDPIKQVGRASLAGEHEIDLRTKAGRTEAASEKPYDISAMVDAQAARNEALKAEKAAPIFGNEPEINVEKALQQQVKGKGKRSSK